MAGTSKKLSSRIAEWSTPDFVPWVAWAAGLAVLSLHIMAVSGFNPASAIRLVSAAGPIQIVLGILVVQGGLVALLGSLYYIANVEAGRMPRGLRTAAAIAVGVSLFAVPAPLSLATAVLVVAILIMQRLVRSGRSGARTRTLSWTSKSIKGLVAIGILAAIFTSTWLPAEHVTYVLDRSTGETVTTVGFVVDESSGWLTLMETPAKAPLIIPTDTIHLRGACVPADSLWTLGRSYLGRLLDARMDRCPTVELREPIGVEIP